MWAAACYCRRHVFCTLEGPGRRGGKVEDRREVEVDEAVMRRGGRTQWKPCQGDVDAFSFRVIIRTRRTRRNAEDGRGEKWRWMRL